MILIKSSNEFIKTYNLAQQNLLQLPADLPNEVLNLNLTKNKLSNLKGSPYIVHGNCHVQYNQLVSFEGGPTQTGSFYAMRQTNYKGEKTFKSIAGIAKYINGYLELPASNGPIFDLWKLPLSYIEKQIFIQNASGIDTLKMNSLLNKYKNTGKQGAFELQQKLIEIGYYP